uniref:Uncharacterized protein n=1 Tax=Eutreptiella gymnastica TaxID=73025 RepID=A0A7S1HYC8_9EUGL|mmetsp:Transcript_114456/g.199077  ORF Transcript_114456/g.199077 Transcript_114456/m.199077 type:complete len:125 (+) Transcript_114456:374-748(+)
MHMVTAEDTATPTLNAHMCWFLFRQSYPAISTCLFAVGSPCHIWVIANTLVFESLVYQHKKNQLHHPFHPYSKSDPDLCSFLCHPAIPARWDTGLDDLEIGEAVFNAKFTIWWQQFLFHVLSYK